MNALGTTAWHPALTPESLFEAAALVENEHPEEAEELSGFAHDFATILNLPEQKLDGGNLDALRKYL